MCVCVFIFVPVQSACPDTADDRRVLWCLYQPRQSGHCVRYGRVRVALSFMSANLRPRISGCMYVCVCVCGSEGRRQVTTRHTDVSF